MDLREHPWNVSTEEARAIQENLRKLRDIPLPTGAADHFAAEVKRKLLRGELCEK